MTGLSCVLVTFAELIIVAVTVLIVPPTLVIERLVVTLPFSSVLAEVVSTTTPLVAVKFTVILATGFPFLSTTRACTWLVPLPAT
ncbi:Uncharacterised protein [Yersinia pseudotuberculosis]|nr:Uncharacterised protein [Yersinia pseudotuberculosis]